MESVLPDAISFEAFRSVVQELTTTEGRLVASSVVVVLTLLLVFVLVPYGIRALSRFIRTRILTEQAVGVVDVVNAYIPTTIAVIVSKTIQILVLFLGAVALLIVWGLIEVALGVVQLAGLSFPFLLRIVVTLGLFLFAYIAFDVLEDAVKEFSSEASRVTKHQEEIMLRLGNVAVLALLVTAALTLWGMDISGLLVGAGFLGIVLGLAAQQTLGSMIAGFVLMFSRPFTIGDWVEIGEDEGIVTRITIMHTRLRNFDGEAIIIPNDIVGNRAVTNRSKQGSIRVRVEVGIDYDADPEHAQEVALEAMRGLDSVIDSPPPEVVSTAFGDSAVILELRFWIDRPMPPRQAKATKDVIQAVKERFREEGIKIPFPQRELSGREETDGFRVRGSTNIDTPED